MDMREQKFLDELYSALDKETKEFTKEGFILIGSHRAEVIRRTKPDVIIVDPYEGFQTFTADPEKYLQAKVTKAHPNAEGRVRLDLMEGAFGYYFRI